MEILLSRSTASAGRFTHTSPSSKVESRGSSMLISVATRKPFPWQEMITLAGVFLALRLVNGHDVASR